MDRLKNIVVGIDFSEFSQVALEQARRIARWNQADLHLIHVIDKQVVHDLEKAMGEPYEEVVKNVRETTQEQIRGLFEVNSPEIRFDEPYPDGHDERRHLELKVDIVIGPPYEEILKRVDAVDADLLMLGSNGSSDSRHGLGILATACVRKAPCRVMIVRPTHDQPFKMVLACVDLCVAAHQVIEQSIRVARQDDAKLYIAHVFNPPWQAVHYRSPTRAASPDYQKQFKENLEGKLHHLVHEFHNDAEGLDLEYRLLESYRPVETIIEFVENNDIDLVVIGDRGRSSIKTWLLGTQAERIVNHTPVSVLVLKPNET